MQEGAFWRHRARRCSPTGSPDVIQPQRIRRHSNHRAGAVRRDTLQCHAVRGEHEMIGVNIDGAWCCRWTGLILVRVVALQVVVFNGKSCVTSVTK